MNEGWLIRRHARHSPFTLLCKQLFLLVHKIHLCKWPAWSNNSLNTILNLCIPSNVIFQFLTTRAENNFLQLIPFVPFGGSGGARNVRPGSISFIFMQRGQLGQIIVGAPPGKSWISYCILWHLWNGIWSKAAKKFFLHWTTIYCFQGFKLY